MGAMATYPLAAPPNGSDVAEEVRERYRILEAHWNGLRSRQADIRALVENRWWDVYGSDVSRVNLPLIANFFRDQIEDIGRLFAKVYPMTRVFPEGHPDEDAAERRERIVVGYDERSHLRFSLNAHGMDLPAAGYTAMRIWPQKGYRGAERFPVFTRIDPLCVLPEQEWGVDRPTEYAAVAEEWPALKLAKLFPEAHARLAQKIGRGDSRWAASTYAYDIASMAAAVREMKMPTVKVVDWYSCDYIAKAAIYRDGEGRDSTELLFWMANDTHVCPVQIAYRPSWGSEPQGLLDDSKGPVQTRNRYWHMLVDYFVQMVYGGKLVWQVKNPTERGPNQTYFAMGPDAFMKPIGPDAPSVAALQVLAQLEAESREGAIKPTAREGETQLNKATAAFLTRAQGKLSDVVQDYHDRFALMKQVANEAALEQDRKWCAAAGKKVSGIARGRRFAMTYDTDEITDTSTWVSYGPASGLDLPTHTVLSQNKVALKLMSRETAIEQDPTVEEAAEELARVRAQDLGDAFLAQLAASGGLSAIGEAVLAFDEGVALKDLVTRTLAAQRQEQSPVPPVVGPSPGPPAPPGAPNPAAALGTPEAESPAVPLPPQELLRAGRR